MKIVFNVENLEEVQRVENDCSRLKELDLRLNCRYSVAMLLIMMMLLKETRNQLSLLQNLEVVLVQADANEVLASDGPSVVNNSFISDLCFLLVMPTYSVAWSPLHPLLLLAKGPLLGQSWDIYEIPNGPKHLAFSPDVGGKSKPVQHILDLVMAVP